MTGSPPHRDSPAPGVLPPRGSNVGSGAPAYRRWVGPAANYDVMGAAQFNLLTSLGLREHHRLLEIGCGSLRAGRLFIPYLLPERYFGIEPETRVLREGLANELGEDIVRVKRPSFSDDREFTLTAFGARFDFVLAQSVFSHTSQAQLRRCLGEAREALAPEGIFAATYIPGAEDYAGEEWVYPGRVTFRTETLEAAVAGAGLACRELAWRTPHGQQWVAIAHPAHLSKVPEVTDPVLGARELVRARGRLERVTANPAVRGALAVRRAIRSRRRG
jgi:SAM-dependent methyltransferase